MTPRLVRILVALSATALVSACSRAAQERSAQPQPGGVLLGFVRDSVGQPVSYARVRVLGPDLTATADSTGCYRIPGIPTGSYSVRASFVGYSPRVIENVRVTTGRTTRRDLVLIQAFVEITEITNIQRESSPNRPEPPRNTARTEGANLTVQTAVLENASITIDTSKPAPQFGSATPNTRVSCQ